MNTFHEHQNFSREYLGGSEVPFPTVGVLHSLKAASNTIHTIIIASMSWAIHSQPPSVNDTHCSGAGLLPSTQPWSLVYKTLRQYADNGAELPFPPKVDLRGKNVLISGANSGLGERAAYRFALWGARVILACRDPPPHEPHPEKVIEDMIREAGGQIKPEQLEWWKVDYSSFDSVQALGQRWNESGRTLDILCNNAGLSTGKFVITNDGVELTRSVNFLGHALLTLTVLPSMKKAAAPKIVNVSLSPCPVWLASNHENQTVSCFHYGGRLDFSSLDYEKGQSRGIGGVRAYCDTKLLFMMWTKELQERLSRSDDYRHIIVNGVHPGYVSSNIVEYLCCALQIQDLQLTHVCFSVARSKRPRPSVALAPAAGPAAKGSRHRHDAGLPLYPQWGPAPAVRLPALGAAGPRAIPGRVGAAGRQLHRQRHGQGTPARSRRRPCAVEALAEDPRRHQGRQAGPGQGCARTPHWTRLDIHSVDFRLFAMR